MQICMCVTVHMFAYIPGIVTVSVVDEIADDLRLFLSNSREPISGQLHFQQLIFFILSILNITFKYLDLNRF